MKYTKKQITEAIAYWKKQLKKLNEKIDLYGDLELELDCTMEKPYRNNQYCGEWTPKQFESIVNVKAMKFDVDVSTKIPGVSAAAATITVSGKYKNVKAFVNEFYFDGIMTEEDWNDIIESNQY